MERLCGGVRAVDTAGPGQYYFDVNGAVAQLGERLNGIQEVVGSIPISSTNLFSVPFKEIAN